MKRRVYLMGSLNADAYWLIYGIVLGHGHELVSPKDPPPPGNPPILDWANLCILVLSDPCRSPLLLQPAVHFAMAIGKGLTCVLFSPPHSPADELFLPYLPADQIFDSLAALSDFLKFEAECPF